MSHDEDAGKFEQDLLDIVGHDLRQALGPMKLQAQMLPMLGPVNESQNDSLRVILSSIQRQEDRIADMLDIVKAMQHRLVLRPGPVAYADLVQQAVASVERDYARRKQNVMLDIDPAASLAEVDGSRLQRVLSNLLARGIKQTPQGGTLGIELRYFSGNRARVRIWDSGSGCPETDVRTLTTTCLERGHGPAERDTFSLELGPICDIIRAHGGEISVQTVSGAGTTYSVYLPVRKHGTTQAPRGSTHVLSVGLTGAAQELLERAAAEQNLELVAQPSGKAGILTARAQHAGLVFVSDALSDYTPAQVLSAIRAQRREDAQSLCLVGATPSPDPGVQSWNPDAPDAAQNLARVMETGLFKSR